MDLLGKTVRELLKQSHSDAVRNAHSLAKELRKEGMKDSQVEEMLYASGFDADIVSEAISLLPSKTARSGGFNPDGSQNESKEKKPCKKCGKSKEIFQDGCCYDCKTESIGEGERATAPSGS